MPSLQDSTRRWLPCKVAQHVKLSMQCRVTYAGSVQFAAGSSTQPPSRLLHISVRDPVKLSEKTMLPGMNQGHVTYAVVTRSELPNYRRQSNGVRRRFRDFVVRQPPGSQSAPLHCVSPPGPYEDRMQQIGVVCRRCGQPPLLWEPAQSHRRMSGLSMLPCLTSVLRSWCSLRQGCTTGCAGLFAQGH